MEGIVKKMPKAPKPSTASKRTPSTKASTSLTANNSKWTRIDRPFVLPAYVKDALARLDEAGHIAYIVGGCVRDFLLGRDIKDHDIATSAQPDELVRLFPNAVTVGKAFGVLKIPLTYQQSQKADFLEIATFREDLEYRDHRHPTGVLFAGPIEDARRRDFTVNALYYDIKSNRILDTVEGLSDLKAKLLRAIGKPQERFREDALRLLRAARFTTTLGFELEPLTAKAVHARAKLIGRVSAERIRDELTLMVAGPKPSSALKLLSELDLLGYVLPELSKLQGLQHPSEFHEGDVWQYTLKILDTLTRQVPGHRPAAMMWAAALSKIGQPAAAKASGGKNFNGHELEAGRLVIEIGERLKMSRVEIDQIRALVEEQLKFRDVFQMREATLQRFVRHPDFEWMLALHRADATVSDGNLAFYDFCRTRYQEIKNQAASDSKLLSGEDLIQLGLSPGPRFSEILRAVEDLALESKLKSKAEALEYVVKHFVR